MINCQASAEAYRIEQKDRPAREKIALQQALQTIARHARAQSAEERAYLKPIMKQQIEALSRDDVIALRMALNYASIRMAESIASIRTREAGAVAREILEWHPVRLWEAFGAGLSQYAHAMHTSVVRQRILPGERTPESKDAEADRLRGLEHLEHNPEWTLYEYAHTHARPNHFYIVKNHLGKRRNERMSPSGILRWLRKWGQEHQSAYELLKARSSGKRLKRR